MIIEKNTTFKNGVVVKVLCNKRVSSEDKLLYKEFKIKIKFNNDLGEREFKTTYAELCNYEDEKNLKINDFVEIERINLTDKTFDQVSRWIELWTIAELKSTLYGIVTKTGMPESTFTMFKAFNITNKEDINNIKQWYLDNPKPKACQHNEHLKLLSILVKYA